MRHLFFIALFVLAINTASARDLIMRPLDRGGNITTEQWIAETEEGARGYYELYMRSLIYPLDRPNDYKSIGRTEARNYLYRKAEELVRLPPASVKAALAQVDAFIKGLDYLPPEADKRESISRTECDAYPYGDDRVRADSFLKNFATIGNPEKILTSVCRQKFNQHPRESLHKLQIPDAEIDALPVSDLSAIYVQHLWCVMHEKPTTCLDRE